MRDMNKFLHPLHIFSQLLTLVEFKIAAVVKHLLSFNSSVVGFVIIELSFITLYMVTKEE